MTRSAASRDADRMARAKKVRGEEHWQPAKASPVGLRILDGEKFETRWGAIKAARNIIRKERT